MQLGWGGGGLPRRRKGTWLDEDPSHQSIAQSLTSGLVVGEFTKALLLLSAVAQHCQVP